MLLVDAFLIVNNLFSPNMVNPAESYPLFWSCFIPSSNIGIILVELIPAMIPHI